jgi:hypothetical protein
MLAADSSLPRSIVAMPSPSKADRDAEAVEAQHEDVVVGPVGGRPGREDVAARLERDVDQ